MKKEYTISVNIMTYNEERCIERCLHSIHSLADEIIIIDTGSTDKTLKILNSYTSSKLKIYQQKWKNNFSEIRNKMIELSTKDIIIQIDADEYLSPKSNYSEIKKILSKNIENYICFYPKIVDFYGNKYLGAPSRIFFNNDTFFYFGDIHEELRNSKFSIEKKEIDITFFHDGYQKDIIDEKEKGKRNLRLSKNMVNKEPENPRWLYYYIKDLFYYEKNKKLFFKEIKIFFENIKKNLVPENIIEEIQIMKEIVSINTKKNYLPNFKSLIKKYPNNIDIIFLNLLIIKRELFKIQELAYDCLEDFNKVEKFYSIFNQNGDHIVYLLCEFFEKFNHLEIFENLFEELDYSIKKEYYIKNIKNKIDIYNKNLI